MSEIEPGTLLVVAFGGGLLSGIIASSRGHSFLGYFVLGFLLPIIGLILAVVATPTMSGKLAQLTPAEGQGWWKDPTGRFSHRYYDGQAWTRYVGRNGEQFEDPL